MPFLYLVKAFGSLGNTRGPILASETMTNKSHMLQVRATSEPKKEGDRGSFCSCRELGPEPGPSASVGRPAQ